MRAQQTAVGGAAHQDRGGLRLVVVRDLSALCGRNEGAPRPPEGRRLALCLFLLRLLETGLCGVLPTQRSGGLRSGKCLHSAPPEQMREACEEMVGERLNRRPTRASPRRPLGRVLPSADPRVPQSRLGARAADRIRREEHLDEVYLRGSSVCGSGGRKFSFCQLYDPTSRQQHRKGARTGGAFMERRDTEVRSSHQVLADSLLRHVGQLPLAQLSDDLADAPQRWQASLGAAITARKNA